MENKIDIKGDIKVDIKGETPKEPRYIYHAVYDRIKDIERPIGVEVGVHRGNLSFHFLAMHPGLTLYMVDAWHPMAYEGKGDDAASEKCRENYQVKCEENYAAAIEAVRTFGRAVVMRKFSIDAAAMFADGLFDFVFIDAAHDVTSMIQDIHAWLPKVKPGGWLCGHDYGVYDGVKKVVDEMFGGKVEIDADFTWFVRV